MKNFFDSKDEKITEKAFSQSLLISVLSILLCIVSLCSITYAWFTASASSGNSTLVSGSFDVQIDIVAENDADVVTLADGKYTFVNPGTYFITLNPTASTTVKGYCVITINGETAKAKRTSVITNDVTASAEYPKNDPYAFKITTTESNTVIEIEAHWGVPADSTIEKDSELTV